MPKSFRKIRFQFLLDRRQEFTLRHVWRVLVRSNLENTWRLVMYKESALVFFYLNSIRASAILAGRLITIKMWILCFYPYMLIISCSCTPNVPLSLIWMELSWKRTNFNFYPTMFCELQNYLFNFIMIMFMDLLLLYNMHYGRQDDFNLKNIFSLKMLRIKIQFRKGMRLLLN